MLYMGQQQMAHQSMSSLPHQMLCISCITQIRQGTTSFYLSFFIHTFYFDFTPGDISATVHAMVGESPDLRSDNVNLPIVWDCDR